MSKFQYNDKVICIKNTPEVMEGWIGYITLDHTEGYDCVAVNEDGHYAFREDELELLEAFMEDANKPQKEGKVKSDGGSSDYYKLTISNKQGQTIEVETGDVIRALVGNDFNLGNVVKAARRMWCEIEGCGKDGIDLKYDGNKIHYFVDDFVEFHSRESK